MLLSTLERSHFKYDYDTEEETINSLVTCDLLIIDDLGTEFQSSYSTSTIYNIFNSRLLNRKPTIMNTNLTLVEISKNNGSGVIYFSDFNKDNNEKAQTLLETQTERSVLIKKSEQIYGYLEPWYTDKTTVNIDNTYSNSFISELFTSIFATLLYSAGFFPVSFLIKSIFFPL